MTLAAELERVAAAAGRYADRGETVVAVLASEPQPGVRVYLCAFESSGEERTWLALDEDARPVADRATVREAAAIAAMSEIAADTAGGGELEELRAQLVTLRLREHPPGIEEAEEAALGLERTIGAAPRVASPAYLDAVGAATRRLEDALGGDGGSPFAEAMKQAVGAVESLASEVERNYKHALAGERELSD